MPKRNELIRLRGVRQNNLKGFDLDIPVGKLTVVTGLSGAGKSSLVFETLHAEGQRRYVETFSPYTRQFLDLLDRPKLEAAENIRPSIAIQQSNTVRTSRSTVGTITELCDYFKVWFANVAQLVDPATGEVLVDDNPQSAWQTVRKELKGQTAIIAFPITVPDKLGWDEVRKSLVAQGYVRAIHSEEVVRLEALEAESLARSPTLMVIQDRVRITPSSRSRFIEAAGHAFRFGNGKIVIHDDSGAEAASFTHGLVSPETGQRFRGASPSLFSFNSPIGACPKCRGFGRVIEIDDRLVIPDGNLSITEGAIRPFQGEVYGESLRDLQRAAKKHGVRTDVPWRELNEKERGFVMDGEPGYEDYTRSWYGVRRFFAWLESTVYKMHVRVFLSKYRSYTKCPDCAGARLNQEALNWRWKGNTLPDLYRLSVDELTDLLTSHFPLPTSRKVQAEEDTALAGILSRLNFLRAVGLGYLSLDRSSRTLSGGETMRVSLTSCLGSSLYDTLFVLDEPSVGLHARDIDRLNGILRELTALGNTVVVVEHDDSVMRAADHLIEIGPEPGSKGGNLCFEGSFSRLLRAQTPTGRFLSGRDSIRLPESRRPCKGAPLLSIYGAKKHNLAGIDIHIPQQRLVCLSGVSGSGKSTLLNNVLYQNALIEKGMAAEEPARIRDFESALPLAEVVLVDQGPVSKTPRSNPAVFSGAWDEIRKRFASLETAVLAGMQPGHFSFNSGDGRCPACSGLGYERVEMQFVSDLNVPCETCGGRRFRDEVLRVEYNGRSVADILAMDIREGRAHFHSVPKVVRALDPLIEVGLGYLTLGQPLNTLSGGESQRLKLVRHLTRVSKDSGHALILIDEPTTGLHKADVKQLVGVLQRLVDAGHSVVVIEHNLDVLKVADWILELGPEAGEAGGRIVAEGTPEAIARSKCVTAPFLKNALSVDRQAALKVLPKAAERAGPYGRRAKPQLRVEGAREHNLNDISVTIPHRAISVVTGVSGSGKSSLAFDIIFAEGQRRFMESMSAYARQFVEQLPRPEVDTLEGIAPTVAIEQRVNRGTRKSTVATITEVAQYLRLLFARIGVQHSPVTGEAVVAQTESALQARFAKLISAPRNKQAVLCAPLIRGRKGHHQPLADWALEHGYGELRIDGAFVDLRRFEKLDRYREHDIDLVIAKSLRKLAKNESGAAKLLREALRIGKGTAYLYEKQSRTTNWLSTERTDPRTGEAYPELDPKNFSWNSPRGWCPTCRGYGQIFDWMAEEEAKEADGPRLFDHLDEFEDGAICPDCGGARLNELSRAVRLPIRGGGTVSLPELLSLTPANLVRTLKRVSTTAQTRPVLEELLPDIEDRLAFMDEVGLGYLGLDRATATLSGGEAQRIRLAAQLGSNLSGALYVLDEPSIGLHMRDNAKLIAALERLRDRGNTLLVVEHDEAMMRHADRVIDLGPGAGIHGGEVVATGTLDQLERNKRSLTGRYLREGIQHPLRGSYRALPEPWNARSRKAKAEWLHLSGASLRNLKDFELSIPKNRLSVVCGVSGAGKSTLIRDLLKPLVENAIQTGATNLTPRDLKSAHPALADARAFRSLRGGSTIRKVVEVDQSPIGKTPRSTPATYIGAFDIIRQLFASLPEARLRGLTPGTFSFNTKGGRCETCKGAGRVKIEMNFMPDTHVTCEDCGGRRYGSELEEIRWNDKSIAEVLELSFEEAATFFSFHSQLSALMELMVETGLGYIKLGQYSPTLSGGEAQRMRLVSELIKGLPSLKERAYGKGQGNLYLLEEPTIGLHQSDCERLIELLHRLVDAGHTVIVIEHHPDIILESDYAIEIGPDGGEKGGQLLFAGPVEELLAARKSITGPLLASPPQRIR